jgi:hypothetical protein
MLCADVLAAASKNPLTKNDQNLTEILRFIVPSTFRFASAFSIRLEQAPSRVVLDKPTMDSVLQPPNFFATFVT